MPILKEVGLKRLIKYCIFSLWQMVFDLLPFFPLRNWWLRLAGAQIGKHTLIDKIDFINFDRQGFKNLTIGNHCFVGRGTLLDLAGQITLDDFVTISPRVIILSHLKVGLTGHSLLKIYPPFSGETKFSHDCFIGAGATILAGISVGSMSVVGAGSIVTHDIPGHSLVVGVPAHINSKIRLS